MVHLLVKNMGFEFNIQHIIFFRKNNISKFYYQFDFFVIDLQNYFIISL